MFSRSAEIYDAVYSFKDYAAEAERVNELIQSRRPGAASLLDVACGTGKHLEELRRWYGVEGVDLDGELLAVARTRLPDIPLHVADMTAFRLGRRFDAVTCLFSSIGYVGTEAGLRSAIAAMAAHPRARRSPGRRALAHAGCLGSEPPASPDGRRAEPQDRPDDDLRS